MESTSVYSYYVFGYNYNILRNQNLKSSNKECIILLREHLQQLQIMNLAVSLNIFKRPVEALIRTLEGEEADLISDVNLNRMNQLLDKTDAALDSELTLKMILSVTQKRFDTESLLNTPKSLLANSIWEKMSEQSRVDFMEGTKCIAMNLPTASAFHLMRSVEQSLKDLYFHFVKRNRLDKPMWAAMVRKLREKNNPKPASEVLDTLDIIRVNYRNPTQHPEKNYSIDEAQDLLNHSIVVINCIYREII